MAREIERKYLVNHHSWRLVQKPHGEPYRQGYLLLDPEKTIRIRTTETRGFLTIKGLSAGATRLEYEYEISFSDAVEILNNFSNSELSKIRYKIHYKNKLWEIDEFLGENEGLIVAEIELKSEDDRFDIPNWIGKEVTGVEKYYNSNLATNPFKNLT